MPGQVSPKIAVSYERCTVPFECKKCLRICPTAVFNVACMKQSRGLESNKKEPGTYKVYAQYRERCTACMRCVEICPVDALTVRMPTPEEVREAREARAPKAPEAKAQPQEAKA